MKKRPKIIYVAPNNSNNIDSWNISKAFMIEMLQKYSGEVEEISYSIESWPLKERIKAKIYSTVLKETYFIERTRDSGKRYAKEVMSQLKGKEYDIFFSLGTMPIAYLELSKPVVVSIDATFASMIGYYWKNLSKETIRDGHRMEALALQKTTKVLYSSEWAKRSAVHDYHKNSEDIHVIPFGANIRSVPEPHALKKHLSHPLNILFVGFDWERKGGVVACGVIEKLREKNVSAILHVVGCNPSGITDPNIRIYGPLDRSQQDQLQQLVELYSTADFFLFPSKAECYGFVACEANAYGIPVLAHNTGGVSTIVEHGKNGFLSKNNSAEDYVQFILSSLDEKKYSFLRFKSRSTYETRLNWDTWGRNVSKIIADLYDN
jgi:glycosyltransferase involved in cell wall biosynthesis